MDENLDDIQPLKMDDDGIVIPNVPGLNLDQDEIKPQQTQSRTTQPQKQPNNQQNFRPSQPQSQQSNPRPPQPIVRNSVQPPQHYQQQPQYQTKIINNQNQKPQMVISQYDRSIQNEDTTLSTFQSMTQLQNLDLKTFAEYFQTFLLRHKHYQNYVQYMSENMRQERMQEIQSKIRIVEECHIIRNEIMSGRYKINLYEYLCQSLLPINEKDLHQQINMQSQLREMLTSFKDYLKIEQNFERLLQKGIMVKRIATKKSEKLTLQMVKQNIFRLEDDIIYLKSIQNQEWTPLPLIFSENESRELQSENKDIGKNQMRIRFKRIVMGPVGQYYAQFILSDFNQIYNTEYSDKAGVINYQELIDLCESKQVCKDLYTRTIDVRVFLKHHLILKHELCVSQIRLSDLFWTNTYEDSISISIPDYPDCRLEFTFQIREPLSKTLGENSFMSYHITKKFPYLNINQGFAEYEGSNLPKAIPIFEQKKKQIDEIQQMLENQSLEILQSKLQSKISIKSSSQDNQDTQSEKETKDQEFKSQPQKQIDKQPIETNNIQTEGDQNYKLKLIIHGVDQKGDMLVKDNLQLLPKGLTEKMVMVPEDQDLFPIYQFILDYQEVIKNDLPSLESMFQRRMTNKLQDFKIKEKVLEKMAEQDMEKYFDLIKNLGQTHISMIQFYKKIGLHEWANLVDYRHQLLIEDIKGYQENMMQ